MSITLLISQTKMSNARIKQLIDGLLDPDKTFVRVPGESRTGTCSTCAVFLFVEHDRSGKHVPLPIVGTHRRCVCNDIPKPLFNVATKRTLHDVLGVPTEIRGAKINIPIRKAKKGEIDRFDWMRNQSKRTLTRIIGVAKAGYLKELPVDKLYTAKRQLKTMRGLDRTTKD